MVFRFFGEWCGQCSLFFLGSGVGVTWTEVEESNFTLSIEYFIFLWRQLGYSLISIISSYLQNFSEEA